MEFFKGRIEQEANNIKAKRGVIYARYSSDMQNTSDSIEVQVSECKKYAVAHDTILVREPFIDRAESGTSTENRKSYQHLLSLAQSRDRDFDIIFTFHTSRWGRGIESEIDEYLLEKNGIKIISVSQPFTADEGVESFFMKGVLRKIDAYYSMQASKYTHAYQSANAQNGFKNGGAAPDGYAIEFLPTGKKDKHGREKMKSRLMLDTHPGKNDITALPRHKAIEFAFLRANEGKGIRWISKEIQRLGWRSRYSSEPISYGTIRTWLLNPAYTGYMVWNRVKFFRKNGKRTYKHNPVSKWVFSAEASHPVIVNKELFERVAIKFLAKMGQGRGRPRSEAPRAGENPYNSSRYLLSGIMECSECNTSYVVVKTMHSGKADQVYFGCNAKERWGKKKCPSKRLSLAVAEGVVMDTLLNRLLNEKTIKQFVDAFNKFSESKDKSDPAAITRIQAKIGKTEKELDNIKRAIVQGADSKVFIDELQERQQALSSLRAELKQLRNGEANPQLRCDAANLGQWTQNLRQVLLTSDFDMRREMVRHFVKRIIVYPDRTGKMIWDLPATLAWGGGKQVPDDLIGITKFGCGGRI